MIEIVKLKGLLKYPKLFYTVHLLQHRYFKALKINQFYFRVYIQDLKCNIIQNMPCICLNIVRGADWRSGKRRELRTKGYLVRDLTGAPYVVALSKSN